MVSAAFGGLTRHQDIKRAFGSHSGHSRSRCCSQSLLISTNVLLGGIFSVLLFPGDARAGALFVREALVPGRRAG